jgi:hypothetical protein
MARRIPAPASGAFGPSGPRGREETAPNSAAEVDGRGTAPIPSTLALPGRLSWADPWPRAGTVRELLLPPSPRWASSARTPTAVGSWRVPSLSEKERVVVPSSGSRIPLVESAVDIRVRSAVAPRVVAVPRPASPHGRRSCTQIRGTNRSLATRIPRQLGVSNKIYRRGGGKRRSSPEPLPPQRARAGIFFSKRRRRRPKRKTMLIRRGVDLSQVPGNQRIAGRGLFRPCRSGEAGAKN